MQKKITFDNTSILVESVYPFKYPDGKVVLRIKASEKDTDEATLKLLKDNKEDILYYESETPVVKGAEYDEDGNEVTPAVYGDEGFVLKATYEDYTSGEYISAYANGYYNVEVTRIGATEKKMAELEGAIADLTVALENANANLEFVAMMSDIDIDN